MSKTSFALLAAGALVVNVAIVLGLVYGIAYIVKAVFF